MVCSPLMVWDGSCNYSRVLFWSDRKRITVTGELKGGGGAIVLDGPKGCVDGLHGHVGLQTLPLGPCPPPDCPDLCVVAYVLLDTVKKKKISGNGFILWSEQYFVIYDSVNGRKSIKCMKFFCLSPRSIWRKLVLGSREGQGWRENIPKITPGWMLALKFLSLPNYDEKIDIPRVPSSLARSLCRLSPT